MLRLYFLKIIIKIKSAESYIIIVLGKTSSLMLNFFTIEEFYRYEYTYFKDIFVQ